MLTSSTRYLDARLLAVPALALLSACGGGGGGKASAPSGPDLVVTGFAAPSAVNLTTTDAISVTYTLRNGGDEHAADVSGGFTVAFYLSEDANVSVNDILLGTRFVVNGLAPGASVTRSDAIDLPENLPNGRFHVAAIADPRTELLDYTYDYLGDAPHVPEADETNNVSGSRAIAIAGSSNCVDDLYEPDDRPASATVLQLASPQTHNLCFDASDHFRFQAVAGNQYVIETSQLGEHADTYLSLFDTDGERLLAKNDNVGLGLADRSSRITWTAAASGTYYVQVSTDRENLLPGGAGLGSGYTIVVH